MYTYLNRRRLKKVCLGLLLLLAIYGLGRLYYRITDGFMESNIYQTVETDPRWQLSKPSENDQEFLVSILSQPFHYLGKGCQSYVFESADGEYVIKFLKYQRFRPQGWLEYFRFLPFVDEYQEAKIAKKKQKVEAVFASWKLAYEELQAETGVIYVHLNKVGDIDQQLLVYDKLGLPHQLKLIELEYMVQKKAQMLCPSLLAQRDSGDLAASKVLIDRLLALIIGEYARGYADNDHALMQNTGVYHGYPVHIDVGQFIRNSIVTDVDIRNQELFNKTWKFRIWLRAQYPALADYTDNQLTVIIGDAFSSMQPKLYQSGVGRIPNEH